MISAPEFQQRILDWFDQNGRKHLPWQQPISPYRVWVSEIMLQQTQVATVIPYYLKFMERFPTVAALAAAPEDAVLQHWAGLGYYARARNLHKAAQQVMEHHGGGFPHSVEGLTALPGIGRSTAGAIASISMDIAAPILDGNVKRVLTRLHCIEGWPGQTAIDRQLWQLAEHYTPPQRTGDYTQAMMDLGATLCRRSKPDCNRCPLADICLAHQQGRQGEFPQAKPRKALPKKTVWMLLLQQDDQLLLYKRPASGIWGGLWSLPEFTNSEDLAAFLARIGKPPAQPPQAWPAFRHTFSHYHLDIHPVQVRLDRPTPAIMEGNGQVWYNSAQLRTLGLAAPVKKLIDQLLQESP